MSLPYFDAAAVRAAAPWTTAVAALERALLDGVDPEEDSPRLFSPAPGGEFLIMPATGRTYGGVKALTVAPGNPARGLKKIQGVYVLVDSDTLAPLAVMDGTELTAIRTPATTLLAVTRILAAPDGAPGAGRGHVDAGGDPSSPQTRSRLDGTRSRLDGTRSGLDGTRSGLDGTRSRLRVLVFGAGVQALNHLRAAHALLPGASFAVVGRRPDSTRDLRATLSAEGIDVREGSVADVPEADVVLCATSSRTPLFDGGLVAPGAVVAAVGQHGLDAREVDSTLVRRSDVVVEGRASALREAGDLIPARSVEEWQALRPANLRELVLGEFERVPGRPCLYSGVGMAWEDLVTAALVYEGGTRE
ncbi:ornithine cyclodeaminase family protein [Sinomonas sp. ASV322]|uniref:ornithine cyclodeaminase family protein n=1 Tax=Sinomonas sp. ASV322 TaxID=3041920 RepID=UPI0027DB9650|nr:ornithine cyclodeaminase family protein [Sinomonas sp. ASV322]MDQ4501453.1 ornithine cyclodeaminase family protein [Sinomonas sp. ASV322]